ncbi:MAG: hypothetical protein JWQ10_3958 [Herbaspirillum sp.]|jgi:hypothetical protein|nr:hypothetical protein [Herbaspirillum sp.]
MPKVTHQNISSPRFSALPYQTLSSSSDHRGRTLTRVTGSASVTQEILLKYRDESSADQMKNWDRVTNLEFDSAGFIARNNLNPVEAEKYFGQFGLKDGAEYLERQKNADLFDRMFDCMRELPEELCSSFTPIQQNTFRSGNSGGRSNTSEARLYTYSYILGRPLAPGSLSSPSRTEICNTVCTIAYDIWASKQITLTDFCRVNNLPLSSLRSRFEKNDTWSPTDLMQGSVFSPTDLTQSSVFRLYGDNYGHLKESVLKALETVDEAQYISSAWKVNVGKLEKFLYAVSPLGIKAMQALKDQSANQR